MPAQEDFDGFYLAHFGETVTLSYAYTADLAEAHDIAQEAFSRAWQRWGALARYENPAAWVRRVACNLAHSRWRRLKTAATYLIRERPEPEPELNPDHVALVAALRKLPRRQREAIVWHHIADLTVEDVAHQMQVPVGTVKTWLRRGRTTMAAELGVDVRHHITAPPPEEIAQRARRRQRARATALAAALVVLVALTLGAFRLLQPPLVVVPLSPSPSPSAVDNDASPGVDWLNATITLAANGDCPAEEITFRPDAGMSAAAMFYNRTTGVFEHADGRVAVGDLTGDGLPEAAVYLNCGVTEATARHSLSLIRRNGGGELEQIAAMNLPESWVWGVWIRERVLYVDATSSGNRLVGQAYALRWDGFALVTTAGSTRYQGIGSIDLSPVANQITCQGLPAIPPARFRLTFGAAGTITGDGRLWDISESRNHAAYEQRGPTGDPYLVLTVACGPEGTGQPDRQRVVFDWIDDRWRAIAVGPPALQVTGGPTS